MTAPVPTEDTLTTEELAALAQAHAALDALLILRPVVFEFALGMEAKLREREGRGEWRGEGLSRQLRGVEEEARELDLACGGAHPDPAEVFGEAVDVALRAMFTADCADALPQTHNRGRTYGSLRPALVPTSSEPPTEEEEPQTPSP